MQTPLLAAVITSNATGLLIFIALAVAIFIFARTAGRGPFVASVISLYVAYAIYSVFPYRAALVKASGASAFLVSLVLFAVLAGAAFYLVRKVAVDFNLFGVFSLIVISVLTAGFILTLLYQVLAFQTVYDIGKPLITLFTDTQLFFWWFVGPLAALILLA